jgi:hypothetical protein
MKNESQPTRQYIAFYKGKWLQVTVVSSYAAQTDAALQFKAKKSFDVTVVLADSEISCSSL